MAAFSTDFIFPSSPLQRCSDRFSILDCDDEDGLVSTWDLLVSLLNQPVQSVAQFIELLDTLANTLRGTAGVAGDYGTLRDFLEKRGDDFLSLIWPKIAVAALQMPQWFPTGSIKVLRPGITHQFSPGHIACLVAHQFLCTLDCPVWRDGFNDFSIWYASGQRHPKAVEMYLNALYIYFEQLDDPQVLLDNWKGSSTPRDDWTRYTMVDSKSTGSSGWLGNDVRVELRPIQVYLISQYGTEQQEAQYQGVNGAVVVSANKHIGFGQSATQEEIYVGNCPAACPAVLFTSPLQDDQALVLQGAEPMLAITGQRRDISWEPLSPLHRAGGRMLFMDALEIDEVDDEETLPDLVPANINREITKAMAAFSSWGGEAADSRVWTGLWGCGAFNGDPVVKALCMWVAASLTGKQLSIICDETHDEFADVFGRFAETVQNSWTVHDVRQLLESMPRNIRRLETIAWLDKIDRAGAGSTVT